MAALAPAKRLRDILLLQTDGMAERPRGIEQTMPESRSNKAPHSSSNFAHSTLRRCEPVEPVWLDTCREETERCVLNRPQVMVASRQLKVSLSVLVVADTVHSFGVVRIVMILVHSTNGL